MGETRARMILVWGSDEEEVKKTHKKAKEIFSHGDRDGRSLKSMVSSLTGYVVNGGMAFMIGPDGSKLGWETSEFAMKCRKDFADWMEQERVRRPFQFFVQWIMVAEPDPYGADDNYVIEEQHLSNDEIIESKA